MPMLGLGTWELTDPAVCRNAVQTALETGYRHVDTAQAYGNESEVGDGLAAAEVPREDVFLATKVWRDALDRESVHETTRESLEKLGVDSLDLLYVHWPSEEYDLAETLGAFNELYDEGLIDRIGISNFEPDQLAEAVEVSAAPIFANQVEMHPLLPQERVRAACREHDVEVVAYSPLARGEILDVPELQDVAAKHDASPAQVSLAWIREKGATAIPKASSEAHIRDNWASLSLELDDEDVERIDGISRRERMVDPSWAPW
jgi:2,5-diketo-D-gluconate reductase B